MNPSVYTPRLREAFRFAEEAHRGQIRKGTDGSPYILHPIAVAMVLARADVEDDLLVAGLLQDVVEDTSVQLSEIDRRFGDRVATTVAQLTKASGDKPSPGEIAKMLQGQDAVFVKGADLIVNLGDVVSDAAEHGLECLMTLFSEPAAKLRSYISLGELLIPRLASNPRLHASLTEATTAGGRLLAALPTKPI